LPGPTLYYKLRNCSSIGVGARLPRRYKPFGCHLSLRERSVRHEPGEGVRLDRVSRTSPFSYEFAEPGYLITRIENSNARQLSEASFAGKSESKLSHSKLVRTPTSKARPY
jgi:hypothetical protein